MASKYLESEQELAEFCQQARSEGCIGLDTEFHRERRYFPKLALVQLSIEQRSVLVDPFRFENLDPVVGLITDPNVIKILHAGQQDFEIFYQLSGKLPCNVFDTQIAAAMLGMGAQVSLANLVDSLVGVRLKKGESFTDWLQRPLTDRQEAYALADVEHLHAMHDELEQRLEKLGRAEWVREEFARYEDAGFYETPPDELFRKVKRFHSLDSKGLAVLRELAKWREQEARRRDRPRRSVVADEVLIELARTQPTQRGKLNSMRGLHANEAQRSGKALLKVIEVGLAIPEEDYPVLKRGRAVNKDMELSAAFVQAFLKVYCAQVSIDSSLIASAGEVEALVHDHLKGCLEDQSFRMLRGWRRELIGDSVLAFLHGEISLRLDPKTALPILDSRR